MKVKHISPEKTIIDHNLTIGKWYDVISTINSTIYYNIRCDNGSSFFVPKKYFITAEEERNIKLNDILDES